MPLLSGRTRLVTPVRPCAAICPPFTVRRLSRSPCVPNVKSYAFQWALLATSDGHSASGATQLMRTFDITMLACGLWVYSFIIGSAVTLLGENNALAMARKEHLDSVNVFMMARGVPTPLQTLVRECVVVAYDLHDCARTRVPRVDRAVSHLPARVELSRPPSTYRAPSRSRHRAMAQRAKRGPESAAVCFPFS